MKRRRKSYVICTVDHETGELDPVGRNARLMLWRLKREAGERMRRIARWAVGVFGIVVLASIIWTIYVGATRESASAAVRRERRVVETDVPETRAATPPTETRPAEPKVRLEVVRVGTRLVSERRGDGIVLRQEDVYETRVVPVLDASTTASSRGPVNLNTATADELDRLPGIGPAMIERIIAARPFRSVRDLDRVAGIGPKRLKDLEPLVTVN